MCLVLTSDVPESLLPVASRQSVWTLGKPSSNPRSPGANITGQASNARHVHSGQCRDTTWNTSICVVHFGLGTHISTHSLPAAAGVTSYKLCLELAVVASPHQSSCLEKFTNLLKTNSEQLAAALCHHVVVQLGGDVSTETPVKTPEIQPRTRTAAQPHSFPSHASSLSVPISVLCFPSADPA